MMSGCGVHSDYLVTLRYARTAEDTAQPVRLQSHRLCLPMNEVARGRVPPMHILPLRSVGVPLIIEVPHSVLIKHPIRVVHPPVQGRMMINRTEVLAISGVKGVGELDFFPASELAYSALLTTVTMKLDIHQFGALY